MDYKQSGRWLFDLKPSVDYPECNEKTQKTLVCLQHDSFKLDFMLGLAADNLASKKVFIEMKIYIHTASLKRFEINMQRFLILL